MKIIQTNPEHYMYRTFISQTQFKMHGVQNLNLPGFLSNSFLKSEQINILAIQKKIIRVKKKKKRRRRRKKH